MSATPDVKMHLRLLMRRNVFFAPFVNQGIKNHNWGLDDMSSESFKACVKLKLYNYIQPARSFYLFFLGGD